MGQIITTSIIQRGTKTLTPTTYGFDVDDFARPLVASGANTAFSVSEPAQTSPTPSSVDVVDYISNSALAAFIALSDKLVGLNVVKRKGRDMANTLMGFHYDRFTGPLTTTSGGGAKFMYREDGDPDFVEYEVTQTVAAIANSTPTGSDKVKVTSADATADFLSPSITSLDGSIAFTVTNPGLNEKLDMSVVFPASNMDIGDLIGSSTPGSILFVGALGDLQQDNANLFFDTTTKALTLRAPLDNPEFIFGRSATMDVITGSDATAEYYIKSGGTYWIAIKGPTGIVGIGTVAPDPTAKLDVSSTTGGFLAPRMTTVERDAIAGPATGLLVYNLTTSLFNYWDGLAWTEVDSGTGDVTGSGTVDFIPRWTPAGTQLGDSAIQSTATRASIGLVPVATAMFSILNSGLARGLHVESVNTQVAGHFVSSGTASTALQVDQLAVVGSALGIEVLNTSATGGTNVGYYTSVSGIHAGINIGGDFHATGGATNYGVRSEGHIVPFTTKSFTLGTAALRFSGLFLGCDIDFDNDLLFKVTGDTKAILTTTGKFGVGSVAPSEFFKVKQAVAADDIFEVEGFANTNVFNIDKNERIGVGLRHADYILTGFGSAMLFKENIGFRRGANAGITFYDATDAAYAYAINDGALGARVLRWVDSGSGTVMIWDFTNHNIGLGVTSFNASSIRNISLFNGQMPAAGVVDSFQMFSRDVVPGNAAPHFYTEAGDVVSLFKGAAVADAAGGAVIDAEARTAINNLLARMRANGLIAV